MNLNKPSGVILLLVWCLFMGVTAISIGVGAIFPALNGIAQPFICSNGHMQVLTSTSHPQPGVTYTAEKYQCADNRTGEARDVNQWSMFLINGLIYGTILFAVIMIWWWIRSKRRARLVADRAAVDESNSYTSVDVPAGAYVTSLDKYELQELTRQYKAGQFSEKEYQRKRKAILDQVAGRVTPETTSGANMTPRHATVSAGTSNKTYEIENDLAQLKKLRDEGLITEQDYEQKKLEILSRM